MRVCCPPRCDWWQGVRFLLRSMCPAVSSKEKEEIALLTNNRELGTGVLGKERIIACLSLLCWVLFLRLSFSLSMLLERQPGPREYLWGCFSLVRFCSSRCNLLSKGFAQFPRLSWGMRYFSRRLFARALQAIKGGSCLRRYAIMGEISVRNFAVSVIAYMKTPSVSTSKKPSLGKICG